MAAQSLSFEEWYRLFSNISEERERIIFHILYATGCSEKELLTLKVSDCTKTSLSFSNRILTIPDTLGQALFCYCTSKKQSDFLFSTRQASAMSPKRLQQIVATTSLHVLNRKITPQDIRATHIYHALLKNISPVSIAKKTGLSYQRLAQIIEHLEPKLYHGGYEL